MTKTSELSGFYRLAIEERRERAAKASGVDVGQLGCLSSRAGLTDDQADHMVENALGVMGLPLGLCVNMLCDGRDALIPMAVEEPSVVAACSYASKLLRAGGGVRSEVTPPHMIGQIQVLDVADPAGAEARVLAAKDSLIELANQGHTGLVGAGGGAIDVVVRHLAPLQNDDPLGPMLVVHLIVDVRDAMGANAVNSMCERLAPRIAELSEGRVGLRILSNLSDRRLVTVEGRVPLSELEGKGCESPLRLAKGIEEASIFAERDPYRASTHNKGIMNGVDAVLIALGQDWRAIEAGAHAYAAKDGHYTALARWRVEDHADGTFLVGRMTLPMAVGTVGGVVNVHPTVKANRALADIDTTSRLATLVAAAGLAQNLSALRALAAEGIQSGHMRLHGRNIAITAGAVAEEIQLVADAMADRKQVNLDAARQELARLRAAADGESEGDDAGPPSGVGTVQAHAIAPTTPPTAAAPIHAPTESNEATAAGSSTSSAGASNLAASDLAYCREILPGVSRTFALSIQHLPSELSDAICLAYLLCRVVDTVEDDRSVAPEQRQALFDAFDLALADASNGNARASSFAAFAASSAQCTLGTKDTERSLVAHACEVFGAFARLPVAQRRAIETRAAEMSKGMRQYSLRADAESGLRLRDLPDLEKYCYYVAGTVGELLTDLFALYCPVSLATRRELEARAVSFGLGLQLVNILKDVAEDAVRGDCFLPVETARDHGIELCDLLQPDARQNGIALLRTLSARAREHLTRAEEYTLLWPSGEQGGPVRLFCAVPLALALGTLREVELADDALVAGRAPSVSRAFVMAVFEQACLACQGGDATQADKLLAQLFDRSRAGVAKNPQRPTATLESAVPATARISQNVSAQRQSPPQQRQSPASRGDLPGQNDQQEDPMADSKIVGLQPKREFGGKVLVTGAAGHVGANLLHRLLAEDRDVRVLLREGSNNAAIDDIETDLGRKVERVYGDLRDARAMLGAVRGCETIYHVAARVSTLSGKERDLRDLYDCNVVGTANLLRAAGEAGVKRTVVTGSLSAIGTDLDDSKRPSDESMPFFPFSEHLPYGRTKSLVEHEVLKACVEGIDALVATSCAVVGPWDYKPSRMGRTLLDFSQGKLRAYLPGGFDFVNVRDLVDGHVLAMERGRIGQRYILSTEFATVDQLMDIFEEATGRPRPRLRLPPTVMAGVAQVSTFFLSTFFPEVPQRFTPNAVRLLRMERKADTSKAQRELGYLPTSVRTAIHEAYQHFARRGMAPAGPSLRVSTVPGRLESVAPPAAASKNKGAAA